MFPIQSLRIAAAVVIAAGLTCSADAALLTSSHVNDAVTNFDLSAQGYEDWGRWDTGAAVTAVVDGGGTILNKTLTNSVGGSQNFNSSHSFVQGPNSTVNMFTRIGAGATTTATFNLLANTEYSIDIFARVVNLANRNNLQFTATIGGDTDVYVVDRFTNTADNGAFVYTLDVTSLNSSGTLDIEIFALMDDQSVNSSSNITVRMGAIGVDATSVVPEPASLMSGLLGLTLIAGRRRR